MKSIRVTLGTTALVLSLAACAQQEEEVVILDPTPIYAKDGTIISYDSEVVNADGTVPPQPGTRGLKTKSNDGAGVDGSDSDDDDDSDG